MSRSFREGFGSSRKASGRFEEPYGSLPRKKPSGFLRRPSPLYRDPDRCPGRWRPLKLNFFPSGRRGPPKELAARLSSKELTFRNLTESATCSKFLSSWLSDGRLVLEACLLIGGAFHVLVIFWLSRELSCHLAQTVSSAICHCFSSCGRCRCRRVSGSGPQVFCTQVSLLVHGTVCWFSKVGWAVI